MVEVQSCELHEGFLALLSKCLGLFALLGYYGYTTQSSAHVTTVTKACNLL
jgi:hypothetical protein